MIYLSTNARNGCIMDGGDGSAARTRQEPRFCFPLGLSLHDRPDLLGISSLTFCSRGVSCLHRMFTDPSRRTPPTRFLYRIPPLNAARFWLARKGRTRCFSVSVRANRLRRWSVRCCTRRKTDDFLLALCDACAGDALLARVLLRLFHTLCHGYDLSPVCLCAFPDGSGPVFRQHALHAGTPAGDPALPPRRSRDGAAGSDGRLSPRWTTHSAKKSPPRFPLRFRASSLIPSLSPRPFGNLLFGRGRAFAACSVRRTAGVSARGAACSPPSSWTRRCTRT